MTELTGLFLLMHSPFIPVTSEIKIGLTDAATERLQAIMKATGAEDLGQVMRDALFAYDQMYRDSMRAHPDLLEEKDGGERTMPCQMCNGSRWITTGGQQHGCPTCGNPRLWKGKDGVLMEEPPMGEGISMQVSDSLAR